MTTVKALTIWQPHAALAAHGFKTIETRGQRTNHRGRLLIHAGRHAPEHGQKVGGWTVLEWAIGGATGNATLVDAEMMGLDLPLGVIVGSAELVDCLPVETPDSGAARADDMLWTSGARDLKRARFDPNAAEEVHPWETVADLDDQLPLGDFSAGRWGWMLADAAPTTERCPWCWGTGNSPAHPGDCGICDAWGHCDPVPARGMPGMWEWTP